MESTSSQNITMYNEKNIAFDVPGWGHTKVSVNESMNAQDLYFVL